MKSTTCLVSVVDNVPKRRAVIGQRILTPDNCNRITAELRVPLVPTPVTTDLAQLPTYLPYLGHPVVAPPAFADIECDR